MQKTSMMKMGNSQKIIDLATTTNWQQFTVSYSYPVCFTYDLFDTDNSLLFDSVCRLEPNKRHVLIVFVDSGLPQYYIDQINTYCTAYCKNLLLVTSPISLPGGEPIKSNTAYITNIQKAIADNHIDRHSFVIAIGGGALLDAVGFVAATSHRGIRHIRVPTTVLAQNDSGVGVKNSINLFGQKNYLGTFSPPFAVLNDYKFIESLPARDKIAGMAEAVKVALIRDVEFFCWLENNVDQLIQFKPTEMRYMIKRCAELHMNQIANGGDPFESGSARPLDFGHWSAHRLETLTNYATRHGEAVAIGIALDSFYSVLCKLLEPIDGDRIFNLLENLGFDLWHSSMNDRTSDGSYELQQGLADFQEHLGGDLTITLLEALGKGVEAHTMDRLLIDQSIDWLETRHKLRVSIEG